MRPCAWQRVSWTCACWAHLLVWACCRPCTCLLFRNFALCRRAGHVVAGGSSRPALPPATAASASTAARARGAPGVFYERRGQQPGALPFLLRVPPPSGGASGSLRAHSQEWGKEMGRFFAKRDAQAAYDLCLCRQVALDEGEAGLGNGCLEWGTSRAAARCCVARMAVLYRTACEVSWDPESASAPPSLCCVHGWQPPPRRLGFGATRLPLSNCLQPLRIRRVRRCCCRTPAVPGWRMSK